MSVLNVDADRRGQRYTALHWTRTLNGLQPTSRITTHRPMELTRITVLDRRTYEPSSAASAHGSSLRVLRDGLTQLRMSPKLAQYTVAAGRSWRTPETSLIAPVQAVATAVGLTSDQAVLGIRLANTASWAPPVRNFWWTQVTAAYTRSRWTQVVQICDCCESRGNIAPVTPTHTVSECPDWNALWSWVRGVMRRIKAPLPTTVTRAQWLLFGVGVHDGPRLPVALHLWGAALGAINSLTLGLRHDGLEFMPRAAINIARNAVLKAAAADLRRVHSAEHQHNMAAWSTMWRSLVRRQRAAPAGYEVIDGW